MTWAENVANRQVMIQELRQRLRSQSNGEYEYVWQAGKFLILHFDLISIDHNHQPRNRSEVYEIIRELAVDATGGMRVTESVYFLPLGDRLTSKESAFAVWAALRRLTAGHLRTGDTFFLQYAPDVLNTLGVMAEVVGPPDTTSLGAWESAGLVIAGV